MDPRGPHERRTKVLRTMCGRYGLTAHREQLDDAYPVDVVLTDHHPRWNIAPTQNAPVLLSDGEQRRIESFRWGLVPHWATDASMGARLINARAETVADKPAFRDAWRERRRCLVLADGFYEWRKPVENRGPKTPYWIQMSDRRPFALAGVWERWGSREAPLHSFTILTTDANDLVRPIHDRMPVVLDEDGWDRWVDPRVDPEEVTSLLGSYPADHMRAREVSTYVNDPRNEGEACVR
jgi:putative SOS response-associated peptidase YedK